MYRSINPLLSIKYNRPRSDVKLFPNPTKNKITICYTSNENILSYNIYDISGQKNQSGTYIKNEIDVSKLKSGLYIIELEFENSREIKKIIIE